MKNKKIVDSLKVIKCQHVSLEVSNVDVSLKFYRDFLGLKLSERHYANENPAIPFEMAFMRLGKQHHDLVLTHDPKRDYPEKIFNSEIYFIVRSLDGNLNNRIEDLGYKVFLLEKLSEKKNENIKCIFIGKEIKLNNYLIKEIKQKKGVCVWESTDKPN